MSIDEKAYKAAFDKETDPFVKRLFRGVIQAYEAAKSAEQPVELPHSVRSELLALRAKNKSSLANNLCPDHRDKQYGKPCLACTIESLERKTKRESVNLALGANAMLYIPSSLDETTTELWRRRAKACADAWGLKSDGIEGGES